MNFYTMYAESCIEDYVQIDSGVSTLEKGCLNSEFQYLDKMPLTVETAEDGGMEFPDLIITGTAGSVPLISNKLKRLLDSLDINNLFYKQVYITISSLGYKEKYWLALPPRIKCLDLERSVIETEDNEFLPPKELMREAKNIAIDPEAVGNYHIFKLADVVNQEIIVDEDLKDVLEKAQLKNVHFSELGGCN